MRKPFILTNENVETAVCPTGRRDMLLFDGKSTGFGVRVTASGGKIFIAQYTTTDGKRRRVVIGRFGQMTVDQARKRAKEELWRVPSGADPAGERKAAQEAARAAEAAERAERERKAAEGEAARQVAEYTFAKMVEGWAEAGGRKGKARKSYIDEAMRCLKRNLPAWQDRAAASITADEARDALDAIKEAKGVVAANRTKAYASAAFGWAMGRREAPVAANPLRGIEQAGEETDRERVLSADELHSIWRGCDRLSPTLAGFVRVLMLTLQRRQEVASMRWSELDDARNPTIWTLPGDRAKNGKAHIVHLSEPARAIIRAMPRLANNPHVFAGQGEKPIAAFGYAKAEIIAALAELGIGIDDWRFHDFRRAGVTTLAGMGFAPNVCDRVLNHVTRTMRGVAAVYQRYEFLPERKQALDAWAAVVVPVATRTQAVGGNVVQLVRAR